MTPEYDTPVFPPRDEDRFQCIEPPSLVFGEVPLEPPLYRHWLQPPGSTPARCASTCESTPRARSCCGNVSTPTWRGLRSPVVSSAAILGPTGE